MRKPTIILVSLLNLFVAQLHAGDLVWQYDTGG